MNKKLKCIKVILKSTLLVLSMALIGSCQVKKGGGTAQSANVGEGTPNVRFVHDRAHKKVSVFLNGSLFTNYIYDGRTPKPVLYPLITESGRTVSRGFPFEPREGESQDHPHHVGLWFNYGDVNGLDFWNNSYAVPEEKRNRYGHIVLDEIISMDPLNGTLTTRSLWQAPDNRNLMEETTEFRFSQIGNTRQIDRIATLRALEDIGFGDTEEGMLGIRVTRELELPADGAGDPKGRSGDYLTSEGRTGKDAWGTRADWTSLQGVMEKEPVSITVLDNPGNIGYPTYWHARGYGLFSANPLGQADFSDGKETLNFKLKKGDSASFKYRILIHNGTVLSKEQLDSTFVDFSKND